MPEGPPIPDNAGVVPERMQAAVGFAMPCARLCEFISQLLAQSAEDFRGFKNAGTNVFGFVMVLSWAHFVFQVIHSFAMIAQPFRQPVQVGLLEGELLNYFLSDQTALTGLVGRGA